MMCIICNLYTHTHGLTHRQTDTHTSTARGHTVSLQGETGRLQSQANAAQSASTATARAAFHSLRPTRNLQLDFMSSLVDTLSR